MFEFLFDLPLNFNIYLLFLAVLVPSSILLAVQFLESPAFTSELLHSEAAVERTFSKGQLAAAVLPKQTQVFFITRFMKRKDAPDDDNDDHCPPHTP
ncbi:hypothetical protein GCM10007216_06740 [Thalassobacillus devorans]|uniref:Uncharacterized protein n=1 Tax=Thalassobacillus devorans TaxID=279813 RepID=A0ABQ1NNT4_9BACI|nr:hypothetical protein [Thalassobacillus devorans]NIK27585.1 hypothetical protein [Thalassobacillus devorans]GGC78890.1 hypothetical protein GCM10007216_06740 [Thalassobacillus devorans]